MLFRSYIYGNLAGFYSEINNLDSTIFYDKKNLELLEKNGRSFNYLITAYFNLGGDYLKKGDFEKAIEALKNYDAEDDISGALALGGIAAANQELGRMDEAVNYYKKAAEYDENNFTKPLFLFKTGRVYEQQKNYSAALEVYNQIKKDYPTCTEARDIDKYIGRASALSSK